MSSRPKPQIISDGDPPPFSIEDAYGSYSPAASCIEYSPDGQLLAAGGDDRAIHVWNAKSGQHTRKLTSGHPVRWLSFSHSGRHLAAVCSDDECARVVVWDMHQDGKDPGRVETSYETDGSVEGFRYRVAFSPDDSLIAVMTPLRVIVQSATSGELVLDVAKMTDNSRFASVLGFSSDSRQLLYAYSEETLKDNASFLEVRSSDMEGRQQTSFSLSLAFPSTSFPYRLPRLATEAVVDVAFSPDGTHLAYAAGNMGDVFIYNLLTMGFTVQLPGSASSANRGSLSFFPDGRRILDTCQGSNVKVWDISTGEKVLSYSVSATKYDLGIISPDGRTLVRDWVENEAEFGLEMLDVASGRQLWRTASFFSALAVAFVPAGDRLVVGLEDGALQVLDASTGRVLLPKDDSNGRPGSSLELESTSAIPTRSRAAASRQLAAWDDDSILNLPATLGNSAQRPRQRSHDTASQQVRKGRHGSTAHDQDSGLLSRLSSHFRPNRTKSSSSGEHRISRAFQLVHVGRARNLVLAAGEQGGRHQERHQLHSDDSSTSPSPAASDRAPSPRNREDRSESSMSSGNCSREAAPE
ncbi:tricorn protease domain 2-containing protein [Coniophora puteana RWD-64-598 SS2]|uniref:Tricorn protease domain 2-containing protein n=1 Tax=Coniophora puteana (strain RWD-64-598) TaxID=741705 RepID=A0A5M3MBA2_CONPW|nr:tricorn protease domain 2-containing protein [Coniophora puteana RWD-64-598 SS2]EIW76286.1 tricorn protease domain 2-containing protein [Coniophora puteana RWD-64-598 SS2]